MPFFSNLKKVLNIGTSDQKKKKVFSNIQIDENPEDKWELVGEIGDGAFGKVHKAKHREKDLLAAAKICILENEDELEDFMVEIDILSEISHPNVITLYEAFYYESKLWVSEFSFKTGCREQDDTIFIGYVSLICLVKTVATKP